MASAYTMTGWYVSQGQLDSWSLAECAGYEDRSACGYWAMVGRGLGELEASLLAVMSWKDWR
jgi:hypothetical protein